MIYIKLGLQSVDEIARQDRWPCGRTHSVVTRFCQIAAIQKLHCSLWNAFVIVALLVNHKHFIF